MTTHRFRPLRAGILNLWHYVDQEFPFADGRLVLRGGNGAGKTRALELLFPLVLDGSLDPRRLDPFGSDGRRMRDNVLAAADAGGQRASIGYAWVLFGRITEAGAEEHVTVGIGVSGSHERDRVDSWSFVTDKVPGRDLRLVDADRRPLSRRALREVLGPDAVFDTVEAHRRSVDARLFGLGEERYARMLDLVLQLRRPKLAALLDPDRLSDLLSQSLPPLDGEALDDVARGLAEIERIADELAAMRRSAEALDALHRDHAVYLRTHARIRLDALEAAQAHVRSLAERLAVAGSDAAAARGVAEGAEEAEALARTAHEEAVGRARGLRDSGAYRSGQALHDRRQTVATLRKGAETAAQLADEADRRLVASRKRSGTAREAVERLVARIREAALALAIRAHEQIGSFGVDPAGDPEELDRSARGAVASRRSAIGEVRTAVAAWSEARTRALEARSAADAAARRADDARKALDAAERGAATARAELAEALVSWKQAHACVTDDDLAAVRGIALDGDRDEVTSIPAVVAERVSERLHDLTRAETEAKAAVAAARAEVDALDRQRARIADAHEDAPAESPWRTASRADRPGAPLWRLVDFAPHLSATDRAGVEGALLAAGLLDAWVEPPGVLRAGLDSDAFLVAGPPAEAPTLAELLIPEAQERVPVEHVAAILASVPVGRLDALTVAVGTDGRFRLGPLRGALRAERARYVGATARESERARRLAEIDKAIAQARDRHATLLVSLRGHQTERALVEAARRAVPSPEPVVRSLRAVHSATERHDAAVEGAEIAHAAHATRVREEEDRDGARRRAAAQHGLPEDSEGLDRAAAALEGFAREAAEQVARLKERPTAEAARAEAEQSEAADAMAAGERRRAAAQAEADHAREAAAFAAIEATLGVEHRRVVAELEEADGLAERARAEAARHREEASNARGDQIRCEAEIPLLEEQQAGAEHDVRATEAAVDVLLRPGFAWVLGLPDGGDPRASLTKAAGDASTAGPWRQSIDSRMQNRFDELTRALGARLRATLTVDDGLLLVQIDDEGRLPSAVYARRLVARLDEQQGLLADRERAVFEDQLLGTLCTGLYRSLRAARGFAARAHDELQRRPLTSGVRFGMRWSARKDLARHEAALLEVLHRDADHLGPTDLDRVRRSLREGLAHLRAERPQAEHRALLEAALDYRAWHRFVVTVHRPGAEPRELTPRTHAQLSGGEKAAALYAPLFAAAQATFAGGHGWAPRLVALDEAFEGVDERGRPELLAVTVAFDLDLLLTGYDLWLAHEAVPAAMHVHLTHDSGQRVVVADLVLWDGQVLEDLPAPLSVVAAS